MIFLGLLLMMIGFALVIPRGEFPGSVAHRNITIANLHLVQTPGYSNQPRWRSRVIRFGIGLAMLVGGFLLAWLSG